MKRKTPGWAAVWPYYLLCRALFSVGRYREVADVAEVALEASGEDYNVYVPILNALGSPGKHEIRNNIQMRGVAAFENHLKQVPEDARARILVAGYLCRSRPRGRRHS